MKITAINQYQSIFYIEDYLNVASLSISLRLIILHFNVAKISFNVHMVNHQCTQLLSEGPPFKLAYKEARKILSPG
jgi:hypothetical protein